METKGNSDWEREERDCEAIKGKSLLILFATLLARFSGWPCNLSCMSIGTDVDVVVGLCIHILRIR